MRCVVISPEERTHGVLCRVSSCLFSWHLLISVILLLVCRVCPRCVQPTTGLDATSSNSLVSTLKSITALGTTVVAVLHQPRQEIFSKFDDLLLLAPGGRTVYFGAAQHTLEYFESIGYVCDGNTNPSDYFIDVIAAKAGPPNLPVAAAVAHCQPTTDNHGEHELKQDSAATQPLSQPLPKSTADIQKYLVAAWAGDAGRRYAGLHGLSSPVYDQSVPGFKHEVVLASGWALTYLYTYRGLLQALRALATIQTETFMHILAGGVIGMAFVSENWSAL